MDKDAVKKAAEALVAVRNGAKPIAALPEGCEPKTLADAYAIQDAATAGLTPVAGWKIAPMKDGTLWCAPLHAHTIRHRATAEAKTLNKPIVEAEIAFRMLRDVPAGIGIDQLCDAMVLVPLFEVLSSRFVDLTETPFLANLADGYGSALISLGDELADWRGRDAADLSLTVTVDGRQVERLSLAERLDYSVDLMARFARSFEGRADTLPAGTIVTTGAIVMLHQQGNRIVADYGALGINELIFSDL